MQEACFQIYYLRQAVSQDAVIPSIGDPDESEWVDGHAGRQSDLRIADSEIAPGADELTVRGELDHTISFRIGDEDVVVRTDRDEWFVI